jgi:glycosyltransferase involved in cell wall biosynthesis
VTATINVLLSTFDGARYLPEQLDSVAAQRDVAVVVTVRDDGSTDATLDILHQYATRFRLTVHRGANVGAARSFLALLHLAEANADYYAFCDQDDVWYADKLSSAGRMLAGITGPALYCSALHYIDAVGRRTGTWQAAKSASFENALVENVAIGCTIVLNRPARELLIRCTPRHAVMHDAWAYLVIAAFGTIVIDPTPHAAYRQHEANAFGADPRALPHFIRHFRRMIRQGGLGFHAQAQSFEECFGPELRSEQRAILTRFVSSQRSIASRVRYALNKDVVRQSPLHDFGVRLLIISGLI